MTIGCVLAIAGDPEAIPVVVKRTPSIQTFIYTWLSVSWSKEIADVLSSEAIPNTCFKQSLAIGKLISIDMTKVNCRILLVFKCKDSSPEGRWSYSAFDLC